MHDEHYYEQVAEELRLFGPRPGLWAKSFAEVNGDDIKAKALYLRYRVEQIERELRTQSKLDAQAQNELQKVRWQENEEKRKAIAKAEGLTSIHIILIGLSLLVLMPLVIIIIASIF